VPVAAPNGQVRANLPRAVVDPCGAGIHPARAHKARPAGLRGGENPGEQGQAHAPLVKAVSDSDWQAARQALDQLLQKLLVVQRLLKAEERLAKREPPTEPT
jgi:hypothetical protein